MITPNEIETKVFSKAVRGYKEDEVDAFLDEIMEDYEKLIEENKELRAQLEKQTTKVENYRGTEGSVLETLEAAKALMNDISASAEKRAAILVKNAELDADLVQRQARENLERLKSEEAQLSQKVSSIKFRLKDFLASELSRMESLESDIFGIPDGSFLDTNKASAPVSAEAAGEPDDLFKTLLNVRGE